MLQICQFFILNAAPMAMDAGRADPHFPKCHIRAHCVCRGGEVVNKSMEFFNFSGDILPERFSLGTEEGIRKLYFDNKN